MNLETLKAELTAGHPVTGAYDADAATAAAQLNAVNRTKNLSSLSGDAMFGATDSASFASLSDIKKQLWVSFCGRDSIDPFGASNVNFVTWIFGAGTDTLTNLAALRKEDVSRSEELGFGTVRPGTINEARNQ